MSMTKQDVRDFVDTKIKNRTAELNEEINTIIDNRLNPIFITLFDDPFLDKLASAAQRFVDLMSEGVDRYKYLKDNVYSVRNYGIHGAEQYGVGLRKKLINLLRYKIAEYTQDPTNNVSVEELDGSEELHAAMLELAATLKPKYVQRRDLGVLHKELSKVIDNEPSGKRAYKAVLAAGVDMADFEEQQKAKGNLPMVVNLSVPVCLLNGNC